MDRHAGFAAAIAIRQQVLGDVNRILYHAGLIGHTLSGSFAGAWATLFLDVPQLELHAADGDRFSIVILGWGPMTVTPPGGPPEPREVLFTALVLVPPQVSIQTLGAQLILGLDGMSASLGDLSIEPYTGGPFSPAARAFIESPPFRAGVELLIRQRLSAIGAAGPGISIAFLGAIATDPSATVTARVLDGVLAVGIDVSRSDVTTAGDPDLLVDFTDGNDIATWTNPSAVPVAYASVRTNVETQVAAQNATLDNYSFVVEEGWFRIRGSASKAGGAVNFSMKAVPKLIRPGEHIEWDEEYGEHFEITTPDREELWFDMQDVDVDVDRDWWVTVLEAVGGLLTLGIGALVVESIIAMIRGNVAAGIEGQSTATAAARVQEFTLAGTSEPTIQLRIERYECHLEGVFVGITLRPQYPAPRLEGPRYIAAEHALVDTVTFRVRLPFALLADDPELRVRWTVRRTDTGDAVLTWDSGALISLALSLNNAVIPMLAVNEFRIECRVYRQLGATATDLFNASLLLGVTDRLDRTHPYVQWRHEVWVPVVRLEADGSRTVLGYQIKVRQSDLHRTDLPGRCRMVSRYSIARIREPGPGVTEPVLDYLDALPFPLEEIVARRAQVCDYCFFGGPTKTVPLIP